MYNWATCLISFYDVYNHNIVCDIRMLVISLSINLTLTFQISTVEIICLWFRIGLLQLSGWFVQFRYLHFYLLFVVSLWFRINKSYKWNGSVYTGLNVNNLSHISKYMFRYLHYFQKSAFQKKKFFMTKTAQVKNEYLRY